SPTPSVSDLSTGSQLSDLRNLRNLVEPLPSGGGSSIAPHDVPPSPPCSTWDLPSLRARGQRLPILRAVPAVADKSATLTRENPPAATIDPMNHVLWVAVILPRPVRGAATRTRRRSSWPGRKRADRSSPPRVGEAANKAIWGAIS